MLEEKAKDLASLLDITDEDSIKAIEECLDEAYDEGKGDWNCGILNTWGGHTKEPPATFDKAWYRDGKLHNSDGPAIEGADGHKEWYLSGVRVTEEEHSKATASCADKKEHSREWWREPYVILKDLAPTLLE